MELIKNLSKTEIMSNNQQEINIQYLRWDGTGTQTVEISHKTRLSWLDFGKLSYVLKDKELIT